MAIEKLKKVVDMATKGASQGERDTATRIIKRECTALGLKFENVMKGVYPQIVHDPWHGTSEEDIMDMFRSAVNPNDIKWASTQSQSRVGDLYKAMQQKKQEDLARKLKIFGKYIDKHGTVWSGTEVANLSAAKRIELFGKNPLI